MPDRCKAAETCVPSSGVDRSSITWGTKTLRSKSTTIGQPPMMGKLLVAAYKQLRSVHRNPRLSATSCERQRGQASSGTTLSNDARTMASYLSA
jgi:hypothetical protein